MLYSIDKYGVRLSAEKEMLVIAWPNEIGQRGLWKKSAMLWFLVVMVFFHIVTVVSADKTEVGLQDTKSNVRNWWLNGGQRSLAEQGKSVDESDYERYEDRAVAKYLNSRFWHNLSFIPESAKVSTMFTAGFLQPSLASLLCFIWFFPYSLTTNF